jgi:hypothetical protein
VTELVTVETKDAHAISELLRNSILYTRKYTIRFTIT